MNTLVVCTNRYRNPATVMPLGACRVADAAERAGHRVTLCDLMFAHHPLDALAKALKQSRPDVIGLSVRNIDNNDMRKPAALYEQLHPLMGVIRSGSNAPVVLGGPAIAVMPEALLRHTGAEWAAIGDGEHTFPGMLDAIAQGVSPRTIPGLTWLANGRWQRHPVPAQQSTDICPFLDLARWLDLRAYCAQLSAVPIETKRGCPFHCVYCTYSASEGAAYRLSAPATVVQTVQSSVAAGLRDVEFVDNVFNSPYEHALAICEGLAAVRHGARIQSVELNPRFVDNSLVDAMERAGFVGLGVTAESASDHVLHRLRKGYTKAELLRTAAAVRAHRLPCLWIFLFGGPGETESTIQETLAFMDKEVRPTDAIFYNRGLRIYPGTELEIIARAEGVLNVPATEMLPPVFYLSPAVEPQRLDAMLNDFRRTHLNCINVESIGHFLLPTINRLVSAMGMRPPLWRHTPSLRRFLRVFNQRL